MMKREFDIVIIDEATQALEGMKRNKPNTQWIIHHSILLFSGMLDCFTERSKGYFGK
jgi:hypothetical protein